MRFHLFGIIKAKLNETPNTLYFWSAPINQPPMDAVADGGWVWMGVHDAYNGMVCTRHYINILFYHIHIYVYYVPMARRSAVSSCNVISDSSICAYIVYLYILYYIYASSIDTHSAAATNLGRLPATYIIIWLGTSRPYFIHKISINS